MWKYYFSHLSSTQYHLCFPVSLALGSFSIKLLESTLYSSQSLPPLTFILCKLSPCSQNCLYYFWLLTNDQILGLTNLIYQQHLVRLVVPFPSIPNPPLTFRLVCSLCLLFLTSFYLDDTARLSVPIPLTVSSNIVSAVQTSLPSCRPSCPLPTIHLHTVQNLIPSCSKGLHVQLTWCQYYLSSCPSQKLWIHMDSNVFLTTPTHHMSGNSVFQNITIICLFILLPSHWSKLPLSLIDG